MDTATLPAAPADTAPAVAPALDPSKAVIQQLLDEAPDGLSKVELARHLELFAGLRESEEELARGEFITLEELKREMKTWFTK